MSIHDNHRIQPIYSFKVRSRKDKGPVPQEGSCWWWTSLTDLPVLGDGAGVDLQDVQASLLIGQLNICKDHINDQGPDQNQAPGGGALTDLPVQPAGAQQGRVQGVWSVGGHDHLDSVQSIEAVHLVQQLQEDKSPDEHQTLEVEPEQTGLQHLHQGPLDLSVSRCSLRETTPT